MSDNLHLRKPVDSSTISLEQDHEIKYWCNKFNCTEEQLKQAVHTKGKSAKQVEEYFGK